jgi:hypothetical protein
LQQTAVGKRTRQGDAMVALVVEHACDGEGGVGFGEGMLCLTQGLRLRSPQEPFTTGDMPILSAKKVSR